MVCCRSNCSLRTAVSFPRCPTGLLSPARDSTGVVPDRWDHGGVPRHQFTLPHRHRVPGRLPRRGYWASGGFDSEQSVVDSYRGSRRGYPDRAGPTSIPSGPPAGTTTAAPRTSGATRSVLSSPRGTLSARRRQPWRPYTPSGVVTTASRVHTNRNKVPHPVRTRRNGNDRAGHPRRCGNP